MQVFRGNRSARKKWKNCVEKQNELFSDYFPSPIEKKYKKKGKPSVQKQISVEKGVML